LSARLVVELADAPFERVAAEVAVAFCFEDDRPLRGPAGRADWRLCGDVSRLLEGGRIRGAAGEALLVPTEGRLAAGRLLLLGLGASGRLRADHCARAVHDAVIRLLDLQAGSAVLAPPGDWTEVIPAGIGAQACLRGAVAALEGGDRILSLRLLAPRERAPRMLRGLEAAAEDVADRGVALVLPHRERLVAGDAAPSGPARAEHPPTPANPRP
jgi:hypothetical protein